jgi:hypothetical protein
MQWAFKSTTQSKYQPSAKSRGEDAGSFTVVLNSYFKFDFFYFSWTTGVARKSMDSKDLSSANFSMLLKSFNLICTRLSALRHTLNSSKRG